jgi:BirA family biotin operon repressor/biotin-[acetyl-CoA-carboxylase] ligase
VLSEHDLTRALERIGRTAPVRFDEVTGSTQATALRLAAEGAPEWTLVAAGHQTQGRGRVERSWQDSPGRALLLSVVLRPAIPAEDGGLLSLLAGTALVHACREVADQRATCKWPNDVQVGGRKVAGILAEAVVADERFEYVVLGLGVNLGTPPAEVPGAGAVQAEAAPLLDAFVSGFARSYEPEHPAFGGSVVAAYREVCSTFGAAVRATTTGGDVVVGEALDVDERGSLVIATGRGRRAVRFGEVEHLG